MIRLVIAGWRLHLLCAPDALAQAAATRYGAFLAEADAPPDLIVEAVAAPKGEPAGSLLAAALTWDGTDYRLDAPAASGTIMPDAEQGVLRATLCIDGGEPLSQLEYFLRSACALLAFREGGLLLHAAGLLAAGQAHLFTGASGSGKTTVVALSPHAAALSDDLVLLRPGAAGWTAHSTPFWNPGTASRAAGAASGPIAGIYRLVQDREVYLGALSPAAAAAELVANCPVINGRPELLPALLARCRGLAAATPVRRLHFRKDADFWKLLS